MNQHICLFPGQGSQETGMGAELFKKYPYYVKRANRILGYDIKALCLDNPDNKLKQTQYTQPAIFVVNALHYLNHVEEYGCPSMIAGHSLGELSALWASGVYDFETGLKIIQKRGEMISEIKGGGMAAVIGMEEWEMKDALQKYFPDLDIANINTHTQIVISGKNKDMSKAEKYFTDLGMGYIPLHVSGAFHSRQMKPIKEKFAAFLQKLEFSRPNIPVISNVEALPYTESNIKYNLIHQICNPVRWTNCIEYILRHGEYTFFEMGSKRILSNMLKRIKRNFMVS